MVKRLSSFILLLLLMPQVVHAAVSASLNQYIVPFGESVQLTVSAKGSVDGEPDVSVLQKDFDILGQSQSSNFSMVNGSISRSKTWQIGLMPKREGMIQIPAIAVGTDRTQALMLRVIDGQSAVGQTRDIWLETELSDEQIYVQAQTIFTVKLIRSVNLSQAELSEPDIQGATVERLGDDKNYEAVVDGRRVVITERKYAVFPQRSGELTIPAVQFDGRLGSSRSMFATGKAIRLRSKETTIEVLPKPANWDKHQVWLPAHHITLEEILPDGPMPEYRVGEPFTRTLELKAEGLTAAQLPTLLEGVNIDGFKLYPDQPEMSQAMNNQGLVGIRREKVAMIPTQAGTLRLPEIRVQWWNVQTDQVQSALIAAREIEVLPAAQGSRLTQPVPTVVQPNQIRPQGSAPKKEQVEASPVEKNGSELWKWFALIFAASWFITVFLWWRVSRKAVANQQVKESVPSKLPAIEKKLKAACASHDDKQVLALLPQWGAAFYKDDSIQTLMQLKGRNADLDKALAELQAMRYAAQSSETKKWSGNQLWQLIQSIKHEPKESESESLKPLYK